MKTLKVVAVLVGLIALLVAGCSDTSRDIDHLTEVSFKLGVCYSEKAKNDERYESCSTWGDLSRLAWQIYKEEGN